MTMSEERGVAETSLTRDAFYAVRYYLGGRWGLIALATVAVVGGLALNWGWLVAAGIAPILLGALPCAAMCALGLCGSRMLGKSCSADAEGSRATAEPDRAHRIESAEIPERRATTAAGPTFEAVGAAATDQPQSPNPRRTTDA